MPLIKEINAAMPLVAEMPFEWQKDVALVLSKFVLAYDKNLTMTPEEQKAERDREIKAAMDHVRRGAADSASGAKTDGGDDCAVHESATGSVRARGK